MKQLISFILFYIIGCCPALAQEDSSNILLNKLLAGTITETERKTLKTLAFAIQNNGQMLEEYKHDYTASLAQINKAISLFTALEDTLSVANNRKFKGYLLARFGKFKAGKQEIQQAISLFTSKNADWGVAVSQFDLSRLYDIEGRTDSALYYVNISLDYWKLMENASRCFLNQNMLIHLLTKTKQWQEAKLAQAASARMAEDPEEHWQGVIDFYIVSEKLFRAAGERKTAVLYQELYAKKMRELKNNGITAHSYFESVKQARPGNKSVKTARSLE
jgi:hypothetical protein